MWRPMAEMAKKLALAGLIILSLSSFAMADVSPERAKQLVHMVIQDCGSCHGLTKNGGLGSPITSEALEGRDANDLALVILDGVPTTAMPPWRPLISEEEALWIANYLLKGSQ